MSTCGKRVPRPDRGSGSLNRRPRGDGGFTFVELVAVMVIVAILAATAAPALSAIGRTRSAMAGRQLLRDLTFARQRAVATGTRSWVVLDPDAETWSLLAEDPASPGRAGASSLSDVATGQTYTVTLNSGQFTDVELVSADFDGDVEVGFDWLGRPLNATEALLAADGTVQFTSSVSVEVTAETGHVEYVGP